MKIALINPPSENRIYTEVPIRVNMKTGQLPPLGLLYLESCLHTRTDYDVRLLDCPAEGHGYDYLELWHNDFQPDLVGITGHTQNLMDMIKTSRFFKSRNPHVKIVWGGPHATAFHYESMGFPFVDYVIYGEGERPFLELADIVASGGNPDKVSALLYRDEKGEIRINAPEETEDLDSLPFPRREILNLKNYHYVGGDDTISTSICSSRGCPFNCTFCSTPGTQFRHRSPENIVDEMEMCSNMGIGDIYFVDDTFNVIQERVLDICREIINRKLNISWTFRGRINLITEEMLQLAEKAGCTRIQMGVETGTDEGLERLRKGITTADVRRVFGWLKKTRITSMAYFMIGCPHEKTPEDVKKTIDFAIELDPDYVLFGILTPYPRTDVYEEGVEKGIIDPSVWGDFVKNPSPDFDPQVWTEFMGKMELEKLLHQAYRDFYGRPGYMLKRLKDIKGPKDLWYKIKAGLSIVT